MKAWAINKVVDVTTEDHPLVRRELPIPQPSDHELLIRINCCGVCHTELDEIEGRTPPPAYPVIPGHQVVGIVDRVGASVTQFRTGDRVGVAWIFSACGECDACRSGMENLCSRFAGTGRDANGGYADYMVVPAPFAYAIPPEINDVQAAPLLCAGAIGFRSLRLTGLTNGQPLGLTGFGASGHLVLLMCRHLFPASDVFVFARSEHERAFARSLGATWAGGTGDQPPKPCRAIIDTTPAWRPVVDALSNLAPGGRLVINAIRKESTDQASLAALDYGRHLWMEKEIKSVANITTSDVRDFLALAARVPILPEVELYPFDQANQALVDLRRKPVKGAKVIVMSPLK